MHLPLLDRLVLSTAVGSGGSGEVDKRPRSPDDNDASDDKRSRAENDRLSGVVKRQESGTSPDVPIKLGQDNKVDYDYDIWISDFEGEETYSRKVSGNAEFYVAAYGGEEFVFANLSSKGYRMRGLTQDVWVQGVFERDACGCGVRFVPFWGKDIYDSFLEMPYGDRMLDIKFAIDKEVTFKTISKDRLITKANGTTVPTYYYVIDGMNCMAPPPAFKRASMDEVLGKGEFIEAYPLEIQSFAGVAVNVVDSTMPSW
jgi:hypothetical protein